MDLMSLLWLLLIGLVAGWLASMIMKGGFGLVGDMIVGVLGALLGGVLMPMIGFIPVGLLAQIVTATIGALILIALLRLVKRH